MRFYIDSKLGIIGHMTLAARLELLNGLTSVLYRVKDEENTWLGKFDEGKTLAIEYKPVTEPTDGSPPEMGWFVRAGTRKGVEIAVWVRDDGTLVGYLPPPGRWGTPTEVAECIADYQLAELAVKFKVYAPESDFPLDVD